MLAGIFFLIIEAKCSCMLFAVIFFAKLKLISMQLNTRLSCTEIKTHCFGCCCRLSNCLRLHIINIVNTVVLL